MLLRYENSGVASLYAGLDAYPRGCFSIIGDSGRIDVDHKFNSRGLCKIRVGKNARPQNAEYVDEITTEYTIWVDDNYYMEFEQFGNADAVPQLPGRCLSRQVGIVRCCLKSIRNEK